VDDGKFLISQLGGMQDRTSTMGPTRLENLECLLEL